MAESGDSQRRAAMHSGPKQRWASVESEDVDDIRFDCLEKEKYVVIIVWILL